MLKPQDVVVLCKLVSLEAPQVPIHRLAAELKMSPSEVHHAIHRGVEARLVEVVEHRTLAHEKRVNRAALLELCLTGLKYVFPVQPLSHARGMPTGWAAPMLHGAEAHPGALPPVWPTADGPVTGVAVPPLYRCVPEVARRDPTFYALMAAVDALRTRCPRASRNAEVTLISLLGTPRAVPAPPRQVAVL
ncbi:MAG: hypothetical protein KC933_04575 [Myxococcales bacterium]|nr:hypothetical protein [Myxococcales bacterium]MCB9648267.1 hypothetical protein [Deltaproteobacteria bacterium]